MNLEIISEEDHDTKTTITVFSVDSIEYAAWNIKGAAVLVFDSNGYAVTDPYELLTLRGALDALGCLSFC